MTGEFRQKLSGQKLQFLNFGIDDQKAKPPAIRRGFEISEWDFELRSFGKIPQDVVQHSAVLDVLNFGRGIDAAL